MHAILQCWAIHQSVEEQLVEFRGNCKFPVYMASKPEKYRIKIWSLCDAENAHAILKYLGKEDNVPVPEVGQSKRVVEDMVRPLAGSGRNVITDNFFTSVLLATSLLRQNIALLGTLKANKNDIPYNSLLKDSGCKVHSTLFAFWKDMTICS